MLHRFSEADFDPQDRNAAGARWKRAEDVSPKMDAHLHAVKTHADFAQVFREYVVRNTLPVQELALVERAGKPNTFWCR